MTNSLFRFLHVYGLFGSLTLGSAADPVPPLLPEVPDGFVVTLYAQEPLVRNPCAMAFDARGRLFVGQGPQYRSPKPDTPGDTIQILSDTDGDGIADHAVTFARGLNCVQGLAWHGRDLWVANAPDLTIVRDLDGDDVADEYVRVYTDLGNIEHALHGLSWAPDGKLYMTKGTSKGLTLPGRVAPKPFRDLWGVSLPPDTPDQLPVPLTFKAADYKRTYQDPRDDWGREGGLLRCDDLGANLEIVSRGLRNPWDAGFDHGFNWLSTDNDQYDGDRIVMPFYGAHFGWSHPWSAEWTGAENGPTVPVSGPVFPGSGTGKVYVDIPAFPEGYRGVWFINDWLRKTIFVYRPVWDGALMQPKGGRWEEFAIGRAALFQPVDLELGPDDALYVSGWGRSYGAVFQGGQQVNEGRIFRIAPASAKARSENLKWGQSIATWSVDQLLEDLGSAVAIRRVNAQDELVRRGSQVAPQLMSLLQQGHVPTQLETWGLWTLGRMNISDGTLEPWLAQRAPELSVNARIQSLRIAAFRVRRATEVVKLPGFVPAALADPEPRVRFEAVEAIWQARQKALTDRLWQLVQAETDRLTFYAAWKALRELVSVEELKAKLSDGSGGVRRAALLALLEGDALKAPEVLAFIADADAATSAIAALWQAKQSGNSLIVVDPAPKGFRGEMNLHLLAGIKPAALRWTTDGSEPLPPGPGERGREGENLILKESTHLKIALYVADETKNAAAPFRKIGATVEGKWPRLGDVETAAPVVLEAPSTPVKAAEVLAEAQRVLAVAESTALDGGKFDLTRSANLVRGKRLFAAAGCIACHRVGEEGQTFGPDLTAMGDKADARHIVESILQPNAIIAEGFSLQVVTTRGGKSYSGILRDETNRVMTLVQADGTAVSVERNAVVKRESLNQSVMPSFATVMSVGQMADLVAWLLSQRSNALEQTLPARQVEVPAATTDSFSSADAASRLLPFGFELKADRVIVTDQGRPVGTYVFSDSEVLRPAWHNVYGPNGVRVTRPQPPVAPEALDHASFHPGIWLGLGDVNGVDFWRNKGRIRHDRFLESPGIRAGVLSFRTLNQLLAPDGQEIAQLELVHRLVRRDDGYLLLIEAKIVSAAQALVFGDQEEMGLGLRVPAALTEMEGGRIVDSAGHSGAKQVWGNVADWCGYTQTLDGRVLGAVTFASPANPQRSWWHVRDYGLMVANPFGARSQPSLPGGRLRLPAGSPLVLRYGILLVNAPADTPPSFAAVYQSLLKNPFFQP